MGICVAIIKKDAFRLNWEICVLQLSYLKIIPRCSCNRIPARFADIAYFSTGNFIAIIGPAYAFGFQFNFTVAGGNIIGAAFHLHILQ